ncbi:MAG: hypothetical protein K2L98_01930 [Bacilli bacterium]|nr:hypothetical protein [Bacilli bacterium]
MLFIIIILLLASVVLAGANLYFLFKGKDVQRRKYIDQNKEIFGTHNEGCSMDTHKILNFYSPSDMGLENDERKIY